jgi:hypothetical protein
MDQVVSRVPVGEQQAADLAYWLKQPMAERIGAVEALRRQLNPPEAGNDAVEPRLLRVCRIAQRRGR